MKNWVELLKRLPSLFAGLFLFSTGLVMNLYSGLGMNPWGVLSVGIARHTHTTFDQASQVLGLIVLVVGWALGFAPGLGTFANMYFIGFFIDGIIEWNMLTAPTNLIAKFVMLLFSIVLIGIASYFYLRVQLGAGPRDGFMMGLVRKLDYPVSWIRATIEITVLIIGFLLARARNFGSTRFQDGKI